MEARCPIYPLILDIIQPWEQDSSLVNNRPIREIADPSIVIEEGTGSLSRPSQKAENDGLMKNKEQNRFWTNKVAKFSVCDALKLFPKTLLISAPFYQNPVPPFDRLSSQWKPPGFQMSKLCIENAHRSCGFSLVRTCRGHLCGCYKKNLEIKNRFFGI